MTAPIAADHLKSLIQRVERLEEEIAALNADKSDVYKEARSMGFDVKAMRKVVAKRKIDEYERDEQDATFELYWNAVHGLVQVHTHARENIEKFDPETGELGPKVLNGRSVAEAESRHQFSRPKQDVGEAGASVLPTNSKPYVLRPYCQHPGSEHCGGQGTRHCRTCEKLMQESEAAA